MYKLIVFDYDGSLVQRGHKLDEYIIESLLKWNKLGIETVIASGRNFRSLQNQLNAFPLDIPIISNNGNLIRKLKTKKNIFKQPIKKSIVEDSIRILRKFNIYPICHIDGKDLDYDLVLFNGEDKIGKDYVKHYENRFKLISFEEIEREDVLSIIAYIDEELYKTIELELKNILKNVSTHHLTKGIDYQGMMEIVGEKSSKWDAVCKYATLNDIKKEEIICVGDDMNDLEMIKNAGVGIAMCNSPKAMRKVANFITKEEANKYGGIKIINEILRESV